MEANTSNIWECAPNAEVLAFARDGRNTVAFRSTECPTERTVGPWVSGAGWDANARLRRRRAFTGKADSP